MGNGEPKGWTVPAPPNGNIMRWMQLIASVAIAIMVPISGYILSTLHDIDTRVSVIEDSRYTKADRGAAAKEEAQEHVRLERMILERAPLDGVPPEWFRTQVAAEFAEVKERIAAIERLLRDR